MSVNTREDEAQHDERSDRPWSRFSDRLLRTAKRGGSDARRSRWLLAILAALVVVGVARFLWFVWFVVGWVDAKTTSDRIGLLQAGAQLLAGLLLLGGLVFTAMTLRV